MRATAQGVMLEGLDDHRRLSASALQDLRDVRKAGQDLSLPAVVEPATKLIERVESDVFRVAVVGEFKRGKSTLINALLGREVLPADVLPCSATLNRVTYGLHPSVRLRFKPDANGEQREEVIGIDELSDYVTKLTPDSEQRAANIAEAVVQYPVRYCRDKADIIDTPGLNDDQAMTNVTMSVLPHVDAAVLVILAQSPFSRYEADFLRGMLTHDLGRVIFVVNRIDEIRRKKDRQRVLDVVTQRIQGAIRVKAHELYGEGSDEAAAFLQKVGQPRVFGISGGLALDARLADDAELFDESCFGEFEDALERFLTLERGSIILQQLATTTQGGARRVLHQANIRRGALHMQADEFDEAYAETTAKLKKMRVALAQQLGRIEAGALRVRRELRPRAAGLGDALLAAAHEAIDAFPLTTDSLKKGQTEQTAAALAKAVLDAVQHAARLEGERIQLLIEKALSEQIGALAAFGETLAQELAGIDLRFQQASGLKSLWDDDDGMRAGAGALATLGGATMASLGGFMMGGVLSGAFSGYRIAGAKGAATGAAAGAVASFGTLAGSAMLVSALSLPVTWMVALPTLAVAGVASAFGAKWATRLIFRQERVEKFREDFRARVVEQLEATAPERAEQYTRRMDEQASEAFAVLRRQVRTELGGTIEQTQATLDELREHTARSEAQREHELDELEGLTAQMAKVEARAVRLSAALIAARAT